MAARFKIKMTSYEEQGCYIEDGRQQHVIAHGQEMDIEGDEIRIRPVPTVTVKKSVEMSETKAVDSGELARPRVKRTQSDD